VVGLRGETVEPQFDPGVLSIVEDIYQQAKSGKVEGIAVVLMISDGKPGFSVTSNYYGARISLAGALTRLNHKLQKDMDTLAEQESK